MPKREKKTKREHREFVEELREAKGFWNVESDPNLAELVDVLTEEGLEVGIAEAVLAEAFMRGRTTLAKSQAKAVQNGLTKLYDSVFNKRRRY